MDARQTVDVGNSSVGVATWDARGARFAQFREPEDAARTIEGPAAVIAVNATRFERFRAALDPGTRAGLVRPAGIPLPVADPRLGASAGADRLAAALALLPGPAIAVDGGTALTVDLVDGGGVYRGGYIAPGPRAALAGLVRAAPALPMLAGEPVSSQPGLDTRQALAAGTWGLFVGGVDRLVTTARELLGAGVPVVATGAWGLHWAAASALTDLAVDELLVHRGIRIWARAAC